VTLAGLRGQSEQGTESAEPQCPIYIYIYVFHMLVLKKDAKMLKFNESPLQVNSNEFNNSNIITKTSVVNYFFHKIYS